MPSQECKETVGNKYPEVEQMDEGPGDSSGNPHDDHGTTDAMGERRRHPIGKSWRNLPRGPTKNWMGLNDGWMANPRLARPPRKDLEICKIKEIEP